jgi:hypothetical protein
MKPIKSKKWYLNQIECRRNAVNQLSLSIDNPFNPSELRLKQAQEHNSLIQAQCRAIYNEINELEYEFSLYYRR